MTSLRQIAANQKNAQLSTGPKTEAGKARARTNALKHGLAGAGVVMTEEDEQKTAERLVTWRTSYTLTTEEDHWLFHEYVVNSVRIDRCHRQEPILIANQAERAELCWDDDRRLAAEEIGNALERKPAWTVARLRKTRQGCDWLLERWRGLLGIAEWTEPQIALAFDLLGTVPELRGDHPWLRGESAEDLAKRQIASLEQLQAHALDDLDAFEQSAAVAGLPIEPSRALTLLHRYEAACLRRMQWARKRLVTAPRSEPSSPPDPSAPRRILPPPPPPPRPHPDTMTAIERGWFGCLDQEAALEALDDAPPAPAPASSSSRVTPPPSRPMNRKMRRAAQKLAARG